jgi:formiminotetrahydrofolate cyclodeaminase
VSAAYRLPKDGDEQKARRRAAVRTALEGSVLPQLETAAACVDVLEMLPALIAHGNRNAVTDATVGALLAHAGLQAAVRNVLANIEALGDKDFVHAARARTLELLSAGQTALDAAQGAALAAAGSGE